MNRVVVVPAPSPDEALGLEGRDDGVGDPIPPPELRAVPAVIRAERRVEVDGDPIGMRALPGRPVDVAVDEASTRVREDGSRCRLAQERLEPCGYSPEGLLDLPMGGE